MTHKKSFKDNPALRFISTPHHQETMAEKPETKEITDPKTTEAVKPERSYISDSVPMKLNPRYIETKSKRLQLLLQPSLYNKLKGMAGDQAISLNELINIALKDFAGMKD